MLNKSKCILLSVNRMLVKVLPLFNTKNRLFLFSGQSFFFLLASVILFILIRAAIAFTGFLLHNAFNPAERSYFENSFNITFIGDVMIVKIRNCGHEI